MHATPPHTHTHTHCMAPTHPLTVVITVGGGMYTGGARRILADWWVNWLASAQANHLRVHLQEFHHDRMAGYVLRALRRSLVFGKEQLDSTNMPHRGVSLCARESLSCAFSRWGVVPVFCFLCLFISFSLSFSLSLSFAADCRSVAFYFVGVVQPSCGCGAKQNDSGPLSPVFAVVTTTHAVSSTYMPAHTHPLVAATHTVSNTAF